MRAETYRFVHRIDDGRKIGGRFRIRSRRFCVGRFGGIHRRCGGRRGWRGLRCRRCDVRRRFGCGGCRRCRRLRRRCGRLGIRRSRRRRGGLRRRLRARGARRCRLVVAREHCEGDQADTDQHDKYGPPSQQRGCRFRRFRCGRWCRRRRRRYAAARNGGRFGRRRSRNARRYIARRRRRLGGGHHDRCRRRCGCDRRGHIVAEKAGVLRNGRSQTFEEFVGVAETVFRFFRRARDR